jgi:hypothetical protein
MTKWSHLPNARHIDRVLSSVRSNPHRWGASWGEEWDAAWGASWGAAYGAAWGEAYGAAWGAERGAAYDAARDAERGSARGAMYALIAWDDCAYLLDLPPDDVRLIATAGNHAAALLLPAAIALQEKNE